MLKQPHRRACLQAIKNTYGKDDIALMADRLGPIYYSVWRVSERLLEVIESKDEISIYEYRPVTF